jgi:lysyl-tRNA synthetase class I
MVYSESFDALPESARDRIYQRLYDVLTGKDTSPKFAKIAKADRQAVLEILRETKPTLPAYWRQ